MYVDRLQGQAEIITLTDTQDVDLVVLTNKHSQEELKTMLAASDSRFYLVRSQDPFSTFKVVWFRLGSESSLQNFSRRCKVDILLPGVMNIPFPIPTDIVQIGTPHLPLIPFLSLLLLKLQGWIDHQAAQKTHHQAKQVVDERDIKELLEIGTKLPAGSLRRSPGDERLIALSPDRISRFLRQFPDTAHQWETIARISSASDAT